MKRKLPPDSEVAALHADGLTYAQIAARYGCAIGQVAKAMDRFRGKPITIQKLLKAPTEREFVAAGKDPIERRGTGDQVAGPALSEGIYAAQYLDLHECGDLLREWGVGGAAS